MLTTYQNRLTRLLQYPAAPTALYSTSDLTDWTNQARQQLAGEGECIRYLGTITVSNAAGQQYPFSTLAFTGEAGDGVAGALNIRNMWLTASGNALTLLGPRPFEWLSAYSLNTTAPFVGPPTQWAQLGQGQTGTFFLDYLPDQNYTLQADCVWQPIALVDNNTVEAIPYPWTDAVAYYAAYLALLSAQSASRQADAARMFERYENFVRRARTFATPSVLPTQYPQNANPLMQNQLGLAPRTSMPTAPARQGG